MITLRYQCLDVPDYYQGSSNYVLQVPAWNGQTVGEFAKELDIKINETCYAPLYKCKLTNQQLITQLLTDSFSQSKCNDSIVDGLFENDDVHYFHYVEVIYDGNG